MNFDKAFNHLLGIEGKFVNHKNDRGGATNYGITQKVYEKFLGRQVTIDEIKNMPIVHAKAIYKKDYWDKLAGDSIKSYKIAYMLFDQAVNRGVGAAIIQAQRQLGILSDASMGPGTLKAINLADEKIFIANYLWGAEQAYRAIAFKDPSQNVFINGWLNRISSLRKYLDNNAAVVAVGGGFLILSGLLVFFLIQGLGSNKTRRFAL